MFRDARPGINRGRSTGVRRQVVLRPEMAVTSCKRSWTRRWWGAARRSRRGSRRRTASSWEISRMRYTHMHPRHTHHLNSTCACRRGNTGILFPARHAPRKGRAICSLKTRPDGSRESTCLSSSGIRSVRRQIFFHIVTKSRLRKRGTLERYFSAGGLNAALLTEDYGSSAENRRRVREGSEYLWLSRT